MTSTEQLTVSDTVVSSEGQTQRTLGDLIEAMARHISGFAEHQRGNLAELRRMNPDIADTAAMWRVLARHDVRTNGGEHDLQWALIVHGLALMTPTQQGRGTRAYSHDRTIPVGRALYLGNETSRSSALYSEQRLSRLLTARGPMLRSLLARLFRMCAPHSVSFDWREMARFILADGVDDAKAEDCRRRIAREYYRAEHRNVATDSNNQ